MNRPSFHVKKGDHVRVISGNHSGSEGKILAVLPTKSQVLVEGELGMDDVSVSISNRFISRRVTVVIVFVTIVSSI